MNLRRPWILLLAGSIVAGGIAIACDGDDPAPGINANTLPDSGSSSQGDGAVDDPDAEAEIPTEGGSLPTEDEDGGITDLDGGFDGGPACAKVTTGPYVTSTCAAAARRLIGGVLVTANYELTSVRNYGTSSFCDGGGYADFDHRGALEVTATSATAATFEFLDQYKRTVGIGPIVPRPSTVRYDVTVAASGTGLTFTPQACALTAAPATGSYAVGVNLKTAKKYIILRLPTGAKGGYTDYRYDEP